MKYLCEGCGAKYNKKSTLLAHRKYYCLKRVHAIAPPKMNEKTCNCKVCLQTSNASNSTTTIAGLIRQQNEFPGNLHLNRLQSAVYQIGPRYVPVDNSKQSLELPKLISQSIKKSPSQESVENTPMLQKPDPLQKQTIPLLNTVMPVQKPISLLQPISPVEPISPVQQPTIPLLKSSMPFQQSTPLLQLPTNPFQQSTALLQLPSNPFQQTTNPFRQLNIPFQQPGISLMFPNIQNRSFQTLQSVYYNPNNTIVMVQQQFFFEQTPTLISMLNKHPSNNN